VPIKPHLWPFLFKTVQMKLAVVVLPLVPVMPMIFSFLAGKPKQGGAKIPFK